MAEKKLKILTIRPSTEQERESIRYVMKESGCCTAAQAMLFACTAYQINNERAKTLVAEMKERFAEQNKQQQRLVNSLMAENERLRKALKKVQEGVGILQNACMDAQSPVVQQNLAEPTILSEKQEES